MIEIIDVVNNVSTKVPFPEFLRNLPDKVDYRSLSLYRYVYLSNQRQSNAKVKNRSLVSGGGRKPYPQKGTGRARAGSIRSPIWRGGGKAHGPTGVQNYKLKLNKKFKAFVLRNALKEKILNNSLFLIEGLNRVFVNDFSTKSALQLVKRFSMSKSLIIVDQSMSNYHVLFSNIPDLNTRISLVSEFNVYDMVLADKVFFVNEPKVLEYMNKRVF
ncbi:50S ribosomal protein L4 [Candidatus Dojkabacteria bacterium]|uniref:Large ribosomal subunit protein uL4 n=1 Tax=Candidatus Dojkabacteria bacterium TaxID=2099670 RepID=A0A3M0Z0L6_9BACT|nr:MAG: 50S ribosomal protein L4 [Candidatus Dojkabacteria bacterium]